jgi:hypothetical protein
LLPYFGLCDFEGHRLPYNFKEKFGLFAFQDVGQIFQNFDALVHQESVVQSDFPVDERSKGD